MITVEKLIEKLYPQAEPIMIAFAYPVGSDADKIEQHLTKMLKDKGRDVFQVRLSALITAEVPKGKKNLQDKGNDLRERHKCDYYLALRAVERLQEHATQTKKPYVGVVRSLKRPEEVELLRAIYGTGFYLVGISSPLDVREKNLKLDHSDDSVREIIEKDQKDGHDHGQRLSDTYELADYFINTAQDVEKQCLRFIRMLFGHLFITPSPDEFAMYLAYAASVRSADMGRQVGAAIMSSGREILGVGCNEVPHWGGGEYWSTTTDPYLDSADPRDWRRGFDTNDRQKEQISGDLADRTIEFLRQLKQRGIIIKEMPDPGDEPGLRESLATYFSASLADITEYGRTVHAEMAAILSCARTGVSTQDSTIYCTTFPCHNCARHIIAAGIRRVVYVEPYPKSKAIDLYSEAIHFRHMTRSKQKSNTNKVVFEPFFGLGPRRYMDYFAMRLQTGKRMERKDLGSAKDCQDNVLKTLRSPLTPHNYKERIDIALRELSRSKSGGRAKRSKNS